MTENEKLRELLADIKEGQSRVAFDGFTEYLLHPDHLFRIDAALAEPVATVIDWQSFFLKAERERDEARAEVERAYRRGAEAMLKAATLVAVERARYWTETSMAEGGLTTADDRAEEAGYIADDIHALPIPEDKP